MKMLLVLLGWYFFKHSLASQRQSPFMRGVYEEMFYKMALSHPQLWARSGPRLSIRPQTRLDKIRWHLILLWNDPNKTTRKSPGDETSFEDLSMSARVKRYLTNRWTRQLRSFDDAATLVNTNGNLSDAMSLSGEKLDDIEAKSSHSGPVATIVTPATDFMGHGEEIRLEVPATTFSAPLDSPSIQSRIGVQQMVSSRPTSAPNASPGSRRSRSSGRTSAIMVEEEPASWLREYSARDPFRRG